MNSETVIVHGANGKPTARQSLIQSFDALGNKGGQLFIGYPIIGSTTDGHHTIDAVYVSPDKGVIVFDLVEGRELGNHEDRQDDAVTYLQRRLLGYKELIRRRSLLVEITSVTYAPALSDRNVVTNGEYLAVNAGFLEEALDRIQWERVSEELYERTLSAIQDIPTIRRAWTHRSIENQESRDTKLLRRKFGRGDTASARRRALDSTNWAHQATGIAGYSRWRLCVHRIGKAGAHPRTVDRIRWTVAKYTWPELVGLFALVLGGLGLLLGIGFKATEDGTARHSLPHWWLEGISALTGNAFGDATQEGTGARAVIQSIAAFGGAVLPSLFLGAVVFKAFVSRRVFVPRNRVALMQNDERDNLTSDGHHLAFRIYCATRLRLIDICASVHLHATYDAQTARYWELRIACNRTWPFAHTHIPYTIRVPLERHDVVDEGDLRRVVSIQGHPFREGDWLMLTLTARTPELGGDFAETHVFFYGDVSLRPYGQIQTDSTKPAHQWAGWDHFDELD
jgi:hypothetical protein